MDFSVLLANLRAVAEKYKGQTTDPQTASSAYVDMFVQMLMKAEKMTDKYEDHITMMWVAVNQLASIYKDLSPGNSRDRLTHYIFGMCGRVVLNVQWAQLDEDDKVKKDFVGTVQTVHEHLKALGYEKFQLILNLMESQWTDPVLSEIMTSEDEEIEGGLEYIQNEDPEILKLRIEIMVKENCEEFALNLCEWSLKHPKLKGDLKIRENQIAILYKQQEYKKMQDVCSQVVCHDGIHLMSRLAKSSTNQDLCIRLAQVFLIQDWVNPDRNCCTQELLKLWIHHQYLADKDEERFLDSIWTVAKVCRSTEQIWVLIEGVRRECGDMFIQLYTELCKYALNIDKGNMEQEESKGNKEEVEKRKKLIARTCVRMAFMLKDYDFRMSRICGLTAFSLLPTTDNLNLVNKLYWTIKNTSVTSGNSKINPATIYEVERLLGLMRPEILNPDFSWKQIIPVCKRYQITKNSNFDGHDPKTAPKRSHDKPNILSSVNQSKTFPSAIPQTVSQLQKTQTSESTKSIERTHAEHLLAQNKNLSNEKVSQLAKEKFPKKDGDLVEGPPLNAKELGRTIKDLKKSIDLNNRYSADLSKKLYPLVTQNSVDNLSSSRSQTVSELPMRKVHIDSTLATHSKSSHIEKSINSSQLLGKINKPTNKDTKNSVQIKGSFNVLRPPGSANQECAKIAQQIAEMHEKQRREKAALQGKFDGLKFALNSKNIPSSSQISDLLSLTIKEKLGDSTQKISSEKSDVIRKGYGHEVIQEKKQPNMIVHTPVSISNQPVSSQNKQTKQLNTQKYYVATEEVMRNYRRNESGNITVGESKVPIKPVFSMAVRKSFNSHKNKEELKQTITNLVKRTKDMPLNFSIPSTTNKSATIMQKAKVKDGKCRVGYQSTNPSIQNSTFTSNKEMETTTCSLQPNPQHIIPPVAITTSTVPSIVSHVSLIQPNQSNSNPDIIMAVVSNVNFQNYNTLPQSTIPVLTTQAVNQSLSFDQQSSSFTPQYQQYVHNPVEITQVNQSFPTHQPLATVHQLNNHSSQPLYDTKTQIVTGQQFLPTKSNIVEQQNLHSNIQIQALPFTPVVSQTFLQVQSSPNTTSIPQQVLNMSGQNLSALNTSAEKSAVTNTNLNIGIRNNVERQVSGQDVKSASGYKSATRQFIAPPELSPAVFQQILSSFTQSSSGKEKLSVKQPKGQSQQTKKDMMQQNLTREVIRHLTLNKNDESVKKSVIEATQKILQLRKHYDNVNQSISGQGALQENAGGGGMSGGVNHGNNSASCESVPELPDLGSELDSILCLDDNNQVSGESAIFPENSLKENNNGIIKVQTDTEMIQQLEKILDSPDNVTSKVTTQENCNRRDIMPVKNDSNKNSQQKQTNSTYLNANRLAKEKEMRHTQDTKIAFSKSRVMCKNCEHFFRDSEQLSQHLNLNLCRNFNIYREKEDGIKNKNKQIDSSERYNFPCSICAANFQTLDDLRNHTTQTCTGSPRFFSDMSKVLEYSLMYKCASCNWMNENEKIAWKHIENCTSNVTSSPSKKPAKVSVLFKCRMCSELFSDKETTYNHVRKLCSHFSGVKEQRNQDSKINGLGYDKQTQDSAYIRSKSFNEGEKDSKKPKCKDKKLIGSMNHGIKEVLKCEGNMSSPVQKVGNGLNLDVLKTEENKTLNESDSKDVNTGIKSVSETEKKSPLDKMGLVQSKTNEMESTLGEGKSQSCEIHVTNIDKTEFKELVENNMQTTAEAENDKGITSNKDKEEIIKNQKLKRISENIEQFTEIELKRKAFKSKKMDMYEDGIHAIIKDSVNETKKEIKMNKAQVREETSTKSEIKDIREQSFSINRKCDQNKKRKAEGLGNNSSFDMKNNFKRRKRGEVTDTRRDKGLRAKQLIKQKKYLIDEMEPISPEVKRVNEKKSEEEPSKKQSKKALIIEESGLVKACKLCSFKHKSFFLAKHYVEKHNVGFKQSGQLVKCSFCRFKLVKEDLISLKKHVTTGHWQELLSQFKEDEMEHSFHGKNKSGLRKPSPSKSMPRSEMQSVIASPRKSDKMKKHLKALALRKKCAENLRKIAKKQSTVSEVESNELKTAESESEEMDCSHSTNLSNLKNCQQSPERVTVGGRGKVNDTEVHNTEISARISGRTRSRSSSQSSRSSFNFQALKKTSVQSMGGILPSGKTVTDSSNVTESSTMEEDGGMSDEKHTRSREKRRVSRRNSRCSDKKMSTDEHYSSDSSNDRSFSRFTRSSNSQCFQQRKNGRDKTRRNGTSNSSGKLQTKSGTKRQAENGALSDDDEITSSTDVSEAYFIATKIEDVGENCFEKIDFASSKYSSDEEYESESEMNERQYSLRKRKQKSDYREHEFSDMDLSVKTSDSERSSSVNIKREATESGDESDSLKGQKSLSLRRIQQKCFSNVTKEPDEYVCQMKQQSMSILIGPDDELKDLKYPTQTPDSTIPTSAKATSSENKTCQEHQSQQQLRQINTTVLEYDDEFAFLQQMDQKIDSTCKDRPNKDNTKMESFNSEFQKFTSKTNNTDHASSESDIDQSDSKKYVVCKPSVSQNHVKSEMVENTQIFDVPVLPPRNNFVDAFHKFAKYENNTQAKACVKEKLFEVKSRNFIGAFESFNEEKLVSVCLTRLDEKQKVKKKKIDWKERFGIVDCSVKLEKLQTRTIEKYKNKSKEKTPKHHECIIIDSESSSDSDCNITKASTQKRKVSKQENMSINETLINEMIIPQAIVSEMLREVNTSIPTDENIDSNYKSETVTGDLGCKLHNDFTSEDDPEFVWVENAESIAEPRETFQVDHAEKSASAGIIVSGEVENVNAEKDQEIVILTEDSQDDEVQNENVVEICLTDGTDNCVENLITIVEGSDQDIKSFEPGSSNIVLIEVKDNEELIITHGINMDPEENTSLTENIPILDFNICKDKTISSEDFSKNIGKEACKQVETNTKNDMLNESNGNMLYQQEEETSEKNTSKQVVNKGNDIVSLNGSGTDTYKEKNVTLEKIEFENSFDSVKECLEAVVQQISKGYNTEDEGSIPTQTINPSNVKSCASRFEEKPTDDTMNSKETNFECSGDKFDDNTCGLHEITSDSNVYSKKSDDDFDSEKNNPLDMIDEKVRCKNEYTENEYQTTGNGVESNKQINDTQNNEKSAFILEKDLGTEYSFTINLDSEEKPLKETLLNKNFTKVNNSLCVTSESTTLAKMDTVIPEIHCSNSVKTEHMSSKTRSEDKYTEPLLALGDLKKNENSLASFKVIKENECNMFDKEEINYLKQGKEESDSRDVDQVVKLSSCEQNSNIMESKADAFSEKVLQETPFKTSQEVLDASTVVEKNFTDENIFVMVKPVHFDDKLDDNACQIITECEIDSSIHKRLRGLDESSKSDSVLASDRCSQLNKAIETFTPKIKMEFAIVDEPREITTNLQEMDLKNKKELEISKSSSNKGVAHNSTNLCENVPTDEIRSEAAEKAKVYSAVEFIKDDNQDADSNIETESVVEENSDLTQDLITVHQENVSDTCGVLAPQTFFDSKQNNVEVGEIDVAQMKADFTDSENGKETALGQSQHPVSSAKVLFDCSVSALPPDDTDKKDKISTLENAIYSYVSCKEDSSSCPLIQPPQTQFQASLYMEMTTVVTMEVDSNASKETHGLSEFSGDPLNVAKDQQVPTTSSEEKLNENSELIIKDHKERERNGDITKDAVEHLEIEGALDQEKVSAVSLSKSEELEKIESACSSAAVFKETSNECENKCENDYEVVISKCTSIEQSKDIQNDSESVLIDEKDDSCSKGGKHYSLHSVCQETLAESFSEQIDEFRAIHAESKLVVATKSQNMETNMTSFEWKNLQGKSESVIEEVTNDVSNVSKMDLSSADTTSRMNERNDGCSDIDKDDTSRNSCNKRNELSETDFEQFLTDKACNLFEINDGKNSSTSISHETVSKTILVNEDDNCLTGLNIETNLQGGNNQKTLEDVSQIHEEKNSTCWNTGMVKQTSISCIEEFVRALLEILIENAIPAEKGNVCDSSQNVCVYNKNENSVITSKNVEMPVRPQNHSRSAIMQTTELIGDAYVENSTQTLCLAKVTSADLDQKEGKNYSIPTDGNLDEEGDIPKEDDLKHTVHQETKKESRKEIATKIPEILVQSESFASVHGCIANQDGMMTDKNVELLEILQNNTEFGVDNEKNKSFIKADWKNSAETSFEGNITFPDIDLKEGHNNSILEIENRAENRDAKLEVLKPSSKTTENEKLNKGYKEDITLKVPVILDQSEMLDYVSDPSARNNDYYHDEDQDIINKGTEFKTKQTKESCMKTDNIDETKKPVVHDHSPNSLIRLCLDINTLPIAKQPATQVNDVLNDEKVETSKNKSKLRNLETCAIQKIAKNGNEDVFSQRGLMSSFNTDEEKLNATNTAEVPNDLLEGKLFERSVKPITVELNIQNKDRNTAKCSYKENKIEKGSSENPTGKTKSSISESPGKESRNSVRQKTPISLINKEKTLQSKRQAVQGKRKVTEKVKCEISKKISEFKSESKKNANLEDTEDSSINKDKKDEEDLDEEEQFKRRMESVKKARRKSATAPYESDFNFDSSSNECGPKMKRLNLPDSSCSMVIIPNRHTECGSPASSVSSEQEGLDTRSLKEEDVKTQMTTRSRLTKVPISNKDSPVKTGGVEQFLRRMESVKKARRKSASVPYQSDFNFDCENVKNEKQHQKLSEKVTSEYVKDVTENVKSQIKTRSRQSKTEQSVDLKSTVKSDVKTYNTKELKVDIFSPHIFTLDSVKKLRDQASKKHTSSVSSKLSSSSKISYINELKQTKAELDSLNSYRQLGNTNNLNRKCEDSSQFTQVKSLKPKPALVKTLESEPSTSTDSERLSSQKSIQSPIIQKKGRQKRSRNDSGIESDEALNVTKHSENENDTVIKCVKDIRDSKTEEKLCSNKVVEGAIEKSQCSNKRKRTNTNVNTKSNSEPISKAFKPDGTSKSPNKPDLKQSPEQCRYEKCDTKCDKCTDNRRSRTTSPKPRYDNKKNVRQIIHGGKIFEIKKGSLTEREFKRTDPKKDVTLSTPPLSNNERPDRSRLKRDSKHFTRARDSEASQMNETIVIEKRANLNDYIHNTLKEIKKERKSSSHNTSNWTVKKERCVKSYKFPYAFKKSPRR